MRAAIYTRFSSDRQREASTEDQARNCRNRIEAEGWKLVAHYCDQAVSGSIVDRPGYQAMLRAAELREFEILVLDDLSRLSRDQVEGERAIRRLEFGGVRVIAVSDGYDSTSKARKVHRGVKGLMNELYLDDLRDKTHRGLTGQALKRLSAGGKPYGYRPVRVLDESRTDAYGQPAVVGYRREIDSEQAAIVHFIFKRYVAGAGLRTIASELNARGIPSPGATWRRRKRRKDGKWLASGVREMLRNEAYSGRYLWNRSQWMKDPDSGKRRRIDRPQSEWIIHELPELRIVPTELWKQAQDRLKARAAFFVAGTGRSSTRGARPKHLLSGLLECGACGCKFVISGTRPAKYVCSSHRNGGIHACTNRLSVSKQLAEARLLASLEEQLLSPAAIKLAVSEIRALSAAQSVEPSTEIQARLAKLDRQIEQINGLLKDGTLSPPVAGAALQKAQDERRALMETKAAGDTQRTNRVLRLLPKAAEAYIAQVHAIRHGNADESVIHRTRNVLRELFGGPVKLIPSEAEDCLVAEVALSRTALLQAAGGRVSNGSGGRI